MTSVGRILPFLLLTLAALGAVIWFELGAQPHEQQRELPVRVPTTIRQGVVAVVQPPTPREAWFSDILSRPLFSPERRPAAQSDSRDVRGLPRLTGIVMSGTQRVAIFAGPSGGRPAVVETGARIGSYEVRAVAEDGVTVAGPEGTRVIRPIFDTAPAPAKPPLAVRPELPKPAGR